MDFIIRGEDSDKEIDSLLQQFGIDATSDFREDFLQSEIQNNDELR